jgi:hypothetical protein
MTEREQETVTGGCIKRNNQELHLWYFLLGINGRSYEGG